jgi:hypothetical protein
MKTKPMTIPSIEERHTSKCWVSARSKPSRLGPLKVQERSRPVPIGLRKEVTKLGAVRGRALGGGLCCIMAYTAVMEDMQVYGF